MREIKVTHSNRVHSTQHRNCVVVWKDGAARLKGRTLCGSGGRGDGTAGMQQQGLRQWVGVCHGVLRLLCSA